MATREETRIPITKPAPIAEPTPITKPVPVPKPAPRPKPVPIRPPAPTGPHTTDDRRLGTVLAESGTFGAPCPRPA
jgi:hypothetical protein